ncbi:O-antigen ligase family protein [Paenibacillus nitricinens]|uniref:O-antigen ligase family protein n=1 Tax=Paenibacillus nitricinens TaxID=3367691 RepID=UPI003F836D8D
MRNRLLNINITIFSILLMSTILYAFPGTRMIGLLSILTLLSLSFFYFFTNLSRIKMSKLFLAWCTYSIGGLLVLTINFSKQSLYVYIEQIVILFFVTILSQSVLNNNGLKRLANIFSGLFYILIIFVLVNEFLFKINGVYIVFYKTILMYMFFLMIKTKKIYYVSIITIFLLFINSTRSSILTIILFLIIYKLLEKIKYSKKAYKLIFFVLTSLILLIPIAYISLKHIPLGVDINNISREYFNKNFFSGRDIIWDISYQFIKESVFLGYGFSNNILVSNGILASTHNIFISLLLQGGVVLLILFLFFMYTLWMSFFGKLDHDIVRISASFILPLMLRASFDLIFLENDLILSINMWIIICVGLMVSNDFKLNDKN